MELGAERPRESGCCGKRERRDRAAAGGDMRMPVCGEGRVEVSCKWILVSGGRARSLEGITCRCGAPPNALVKPKVGMVRDGVV